MTSNLKDSFNHALLKTLREQSNLTVRDVAEKIGVSPSRITRWESGPDKPRLDHLRKLASLFKINHKKFLQPNGNGAQA